jgi:ABC-type dipeptide/oligopeptide/nickel transport system permease subunit
MPVFWVGLLHMLRFLGLGIPRPQPLWGIMLAKSQTYLYAAWWLASIVPSFIRLAAD